MYVQIFEGAHSTFFRSSAKPWRGARIDLCRINYLSQPQQRIYLFFSLLDYES